MAYIDSPLKYKDYVSTYVHCFTKYIISPRPMSTVIILQIRNLCQPSKLNTIFLSCTFKTSDFIPSKMNLKSVFFNYQGKGLEIQHWTSTSIPNPLFLPSP